MSYFIHVDGLDMQQPVIDECQILSRLLKSLIIFCMISFCFQIAVTQKPDPAPVTKASGGYFTTITPILSCIKASIYQLDNNDSLS